MSKKYLFVALTIFLSSLLYSLDQSSDLDKDIVNKFYLGDIKISGIKYAYKRIKNELPIKSGDLWDEVSKKRVNDYFLEMRAKKILEANEPIIIESYSENSENIVNLDITLSEQLSFFFFIFPFYSTTYLFKAKIKYWNFYIDGYDFPFEAELEFLQKDRFNFAVRSTDPITLTKFLNLQFDFVAYTTTINYLIPFGDTRLNEKWKNGIDSLFLKFNYKDPKSNIQLMPSMGFGYANILTSDQTGDISTIKDEYHVLMVTPKFGFNILLDIINSNFNGEVGFGFKNEYQVRDNRKDIFNKQEISISLVPHNLKDVPKDIKDPLSYPINLNYSYTFPKVKINFLSKFNFALRKFIQDSDTNSTIDTILIQEFDKGVFEDTILDFQEIKNSTNNLVEKFKKWYRYDDDNKKYVLNNASLDEKNEIWDILTNPKVGFIYSNGFLINPLFSFNIPIDNSGFSLIPTFDFRFMSKWQDNRSSNNSLSFSQNLDFNYDIKIIEAFLNGGIGLNISKSYTNYQNDPLHDEKNTFSISKIYIGFSKKASIPESYLINQKIPLDIRKKSGHTINFKINFESDPVTNNGVFNPTRFNFIFESQYSLYLPVYKESRFKMRLSLFGAFNKNNEKIGDTTILGDWIRGKGYDYFGGYFGFVSNFEYWIDLFNIKTPKFIGTRANKEFIWKIFWIFYLDFALSLNDKIIDPLTIDVNNIHLLPAITIGTSIKVYPKFVPLFINIDVNFNTYNLIKKKDILSNLFFEFSIGRQVDGNWFSL